MWTHSASLTKGHTRLRYMYRIYSLVWRQLWAYNTHKIIGRGHNLRQIISRVLYAHNCRAIYMCVFYTMVTQKYAFDITVVKVETIYRDLVLKIQLDGLVARH